MPQIINENPGIGALLGTGLGQGISSGLQQLAQLKTGQLLSRHQQRQTASGLSALGFSPEEANQISVLPQELQGLVIKNYLSAAQNSGLDQALQAIQVNPESQQASSQPQAMQQGTRLPQQQGIGALLGLQGQPGILNRQLPTEQAFAKIMGSQQEAERPIATGANISQRAESGAPRNRLAELLTNPRLTPEHRLRVEALKQQKDLAEKRLTSRQQELINKETKPFYDEIQKRAKAAEGSDIRLDKMEALVDKGNLTSPVWGSFLRTLSNGIFGFGIDLTSLLNADSQEFEKLSNDFIKDAKEFFPGRVTDLDLKSFFKTIPTLSQTRAGKKRIIKNMRMFNAISKAQRSAGNAIIKENGGKRPEGFEQLVDEFSAPQIDKIKKEFADMAVPVDQRYFRELFNG